jgi:hypothetical protein
VGEPVGAPVQLPVGPPLAAKDDGDRVRGARSLSLE